MHVYACKCEGRRTGLATLVCVGGCGEWGVMSRWYWSLVAGRWSLVAGGTGRWSLVAGRWSQVSTGRWSQVVLVAGRWSLVAGRWSLVASGTGRWSLVAGKYWSRESRDCRHWNTISKCNNDKLFAADRETERRRDGETERWINNRRSAGQRHVREGSSHPSVLRSHEIHPGRRPKACERRLLSAFRPSEP